MLDLIDRWRRPLLALAWLLALVALGYRLGHARYSFEQETSDPDEVLRNDRNNGHTTIDFGGQWMMGRMLVAGHGRELYHRTRHWQVALDSYPRADESPLAKEHDGESLVGSFMGYDTPEWKTAAGAVALHIGGPDQAWLACAGLAVSAEALRPDSPTFRAVTEPTIEGGGIGGPLYPPVHALVMAPFGAVSPRTAYFTMQWVQTACCLLVGLGVSYMTRGRFAAPLAVLIVVFWPGCRPGIDLGQNPPLTLAILVWGWALNVRGHPRAAGLVWGLLAYKPVWALSFWVSLVALRQWRMLATMTLVGVGTIGITLPLVGVGAWLDWLRVGQVAADLYNIDGNWVPLSRDLLGFTRRLTLDFTESRDTRDFPGALIASWAVWLVMMEFGIRCLTLRGGRKIDLQGPLPGMVFLLAWMCSFHFMYYDSMISAFGLLVLIPRMWTLWDDREPPTRTGWRVNSFLLNMIVAMIVLETVFYSIRPVATVRLERYSVETTRADSSTEMTRVQIGVGDGFPVETMLMMAVVFWAGWQVLRGDRRREPG